MAKPPKITGKTFRLNMLRRHSRNGWKADSSVVYNKISMTPAERIWIETFTPDAKIEVKFVPHYQYAPTFKMGNWDGKATYVTFKDRQDALLFKLHWWNFPHGSGL